MGVLTVAVSLGCCERGIVVGGGLGVGVVRGTLSLIGCLILGLRSVGLLVS